jgi:hypothetical protein
MTTDTRLKWCKGREIAVKETELISVFSLKIRGSDQRKEYMGRYSKVGVKLDSL